MTIHERTIAAHAQTPCPGAEQVGWFAARQPAVIRFLEARLLSQDGDAFAVGLEGAWQMCELFQSIDGVPPPRLTSSVLDRVAHAVERGDDLLAVRRQLALLEWVAYWVAAPPVPLRPDEREAVGIALTAIACALDEATTGRPLASMVSRIEARLHASLG
jgi:hypothetical protein